MTNTAQATSPIIYLSGVEMRAALDAGRVFTNAQQCWDGTYAVEEVPA